MVIRGCGMETKRPAECQAPSRHPVGLRSLSPGQGGPTFFSHAKRRKEASSQAVVMGKMHHFSSGPETNMVCLGGRDPKGRGWNLQAHRDPLPGLYSPATLGYL